MKGNLIPPEESLVGGNGQAPETTTDTQIGPTLDLTELK